jgi:hypothetical protein
MPELFVFLIKVNVSLILFCLAYFFVMRRLTYYKLNRVFLLGGILLSTIYPLFDLSNLFKESPKLIIAVQDQLPAAVQQTSSAVDVWSLLIMCFWAGVILMGLRLFIRLCALLRIHRQSTPSKVNSYAVRLLQGNVSTFSFWNNIYLNPEQHQKEEISAILQHEQVHVKDFHTLDILLAELSTVFYWFNPGAWLMRKAIKENVEFITDHQTLKTGIDRKAYQYSMLHASTGLHASELITNFNITATKRRIVMMNSKRTSSFYLFSYLLVIVGIVFAISAFTVTKIQVDSKSEKGNISIKPHRTPKLEGIAALSKSEKVKASTDIIKANSPLKNNASVRSNKPGKAQVSVLVVTKGQTTQRIVSRGYNADTVGSATQTPAKINSITVLPTSNDAEVHTLQKARTFVNDKEVTAEQMKHINSADIISVNVKKNEDPSKDAIYIYTKPL